MPKIPRKQLSNVMETSKTKHAENKKSMEKAVKDVVENGLSIREAADRNGISKSALSRKIIKFKNEGETEKQEFDFGRKHGFRCVFTAEEEKLLAEYLIQASKMCYGLTLKDTQKLAYRYAIANKKKIPPSWIEKESAGIEWAFLFRQRHPTLSLRSPEPTSLSRATSFNKTNVDLFYGNIRDLLEEHKLQAHQIYNCDETSVTTVHKPPKILSLKQQKQVGKITSAERGILVTMCATICANGTFIPPFFIFPRKNFKPHMLTGAPPGSAGAAYPSGWMTSENFLHYMNHFVKHVRCSKNDKVLVVLDNHESHYDIHVINFCKENGIILLTLPSHCSHKMQPLDLCCFGPFKMHYNRAVDEWMLNNPGIPMNIYNIADVVGKAFPLAFTPSNIIKSFERSGIHPFNSNVFDDSDFLSSYVTDRPQDTSVASDISRENVGSSLVSNPSTSAIIVPQVVRPHLKANPRRGTKRGRKTKKSTILTSTPNKKEIEDAHFKRLEKKEKSNAMTKTKRKINFDTSSSESEIDITESCNDSSEFSDTEDLELNTEDLELDALSEGDFILVKLSSKRTTKYFVAKITKKNNLDFHITYLKKGIKWIFTFPDDEDSDIIERDDIILKLPLPVVTGGTARTSKRFTFNVDLSNYNVS